MNNIDEMWPICHDCPYWEVCEPPFICEATEQKMKVARSGRNNVMPVGVKIGKSEPKQADAY